MKLLLVHSSQTLNRRAFLPSVLVTAIAGSAIADFVVRGKPRLMVVGEDEWQIALLLAARTRVLILNGEPTPDALETIPMLLSVMRQRIDVVIGSSVGLALLPPDFRERWMVRRIIPVPDEGDIQTEKTVLGQVLHLSNNLHVEVSASPRGFWARTSGDITRTATGIVTISCSESIITIGRNLETIADLGPSSTTVAIAPTGSIDYLARHLRVPTICINADQAREQKMDFRASHLVPPAMRSLVRIFPLDVAEFALQEQGITVPAWRQPFEHL